MSLAVPVGMQRALGLVLLLWSVPLAAHLLLRSGSSRAMALFAAFATGTLLVGATQPCRARCGAASTTLLGLGLLAGFASYPAWLLLIVGAGLALGLAPRAPLPPGAGSPLVWATTIGLAPVFEELGYRGRLLPALERAIGTVPAVVLSSLLFAIPHLEPWTLLATFLLGIALGAAMKLVGSVALCIGIHMGLNLAALVLGVPPVLR